MFSIRATRAVPSWSPWSELGAESYEPDCEPLAASLIPDPPDVYHEGGASFFFRQSSRTLLTSIFRVAEPRQAATIPKLLTLPRAELRQKLASTPADALIDPRAHEQGAGIVATAAKRHQTLSVLARGRSQKMECTGVVETAAGLALPEFI